MVNEFYFPPDKIKNLYKFGQGYLVYRGDNSHTCVNLGCFKDIKQLPYQKIEKKNKQEGLNLYQRYFRNAKVGMPIQNEPKRRKKLKVVNETLEYKG